VLRHACSWPRKEKKRGQQAWSWNAAPPGGAAALGIIRCAPPALRIDDGCRGALPLPLPPRPCHRPSGWLTGNAAMARASSLIAPYATARRHHRLFPRFSLLHEERMFRFQSSQNYPTVRAGTPRQGCDRQSRLETVRGSTGSRHRVAQSFAQPQRSSP
jgi:hypothetical protein